MVNNKGYETRILKKCPRRSIRFVSDMDRRPIRIRYGKIRHKNNKKIKLILDWIEYVGGMWRICQDTFSDNVFNFLLKK